MTPEQMQARSQEKVNQVMSLMKTLNIQAEAREHINREGFIEKVVFWVDSENYPQTPTPEVTETKDEPDTQAA